MDQCIYQRVSGSKICFLVLYVDNILLATNDKSLLYEVKQFLSKNFDKKYMGEASSVVGIRSIGKDLEAFWVCLKRSIAIMFWRHLTRKIVH